jgi:tight adherence protein C
MGIAILAFCGVFLLIASAGLILFYREAMVARILSVAGQQREEKESFTGRLQNASSSIGVVVESLEKVIPKSQSEISVVQQRLIRAGYRNDAAVKFFYGSKVVTILVLCLAVTFTGVAANSPLIFYIAAMGLGYLAPDFWLGKKISSRQSKIRLTLPDLLDLLVICVEAGLGIDQATARAALELAPTHPILADELDLVVLEQRAGRPRSDAWKHMAERTDVEVVRNLVSMLVQSEQFGTSIAKTLRTHSETLRTQRIQTVEEMAAKTTVKLIFPLVLFIFPCLFLVTLGPAVILMSDEFKNFLH